MDAQDRRFEEAWQEAFTGVECTPPEHVWSGIEDALDGKKTKKGISKRLWLLKLAMAASVVYGMSTTGLNLSDQGFSLTPWVEEEAAIVRELEKESVEHEDFAIPFFMDDQSAPEHIADEPDNIASLGTTLFEMPALASREIYKQPMLPLFRRTAPKGFSASANFAGGAGRAQQASFVSNSQSFEGNASQAMIDASSVTLDGPILNMGIGFRARVHENWMLLTGVNYQQRSGSGKSYHVQNTATGPAAWVGNPNQLPSDVVESGPYAVDHRLQYVSVPIQVGYVLMDDKVDVVVYGGISNDVLVGHKVSAPDENIASANVTDSSSFRNYSLSGIVSAEVSYALNDNYSVSVYPQVRKTLTSLTKEVDTKPLALEMGVRLSYNIN